MKYRPLLGMILLPGLVFVASCSSGAPAAPSSSSQAATFTFAASSVPATAQVTTAPTQGAVSSASPTQMTTPTSAPSATLPKPTATRAATTVASKPGTFGKADLDKIFPPGKGQNLVFQACVNCHNWVPLVMAGFDKAGWQQNKMNHRERVSSLSDQDFDFLYNYLVETFPQGRPVPDNIPEDLLSQWTSY